MERTKKRVITGKVISNKMDKSIVVLVTSIKKHPLYQKTIKGRKKFMAHDEKNECKQDDVVQIVESRPRSKMKRWNVLSIVEKAQA